MIGIDLSNTQLFNVGIDIFSAILALIIYFSYKHFFSESYENEQICGLEMILCIVLIADIGTWLLDGISGRGFGFLLFFCHIIYNLGFVLAMGYWTKYAYFRVRGVPMSDRLRRVFLRNPFLIFTVFLTTTPITGWCFRIDSSNVYHRGSLSMPYYLLLVAYLIVSMIMALLYYRKEQLPDRKGELLTIAFFPVPMLAGGLLQLMAYGLSLEWPCAVISSLLIILNKCKRSISRDSLTGINNRRNLDLYLSTYPEERPITVIMMDINDFKHINDHYGHGLGDEALECAAEVMRMACARSSVFLARYGGDEFVMIVNSDFKKEGDVIVERIRNGFDALNQTDKLPFDISVSIGQGTALRASKEIIRQCFADADDDMYREKDKYHGRTKDQRE
mgnify:FL=1